MMAKRRPKDIGTAAETAVARWLQNNGWPHAERRALRGSHDAGDITGTPGICWEVKAGQAAANASDGTIQNWLTQAAIEGTVTEADISVLIQRRRGKASPADWWAWISIAELVDLADRTMTHDLHLSYIGGIACRLRLEHFTTIARQAGYGDALEEAAK